jgi:hypothetical protein
MCSARLACRSPPGLRRWRLVLPDEALTGAGGAERSERAFAFAESVDVLTGGDQEPAGVPGLDREQTGRPGSGRGHEMLELGIEHTDLAVKRADAIGERFADGDLLPQRLERP